MLAAGAGTRFGAPKAPFLFEDERLVDRAVRALRDAGCSPILVVLGAWIGDVPDAHVVINPCWAEGMASSLRCGLEELEDMEKAEAALVLLVDQPWITSQAIHRVMENPAPIVQASYSGRPGHPVKFSREHWQPLITTLDGDAGARDYLARTTPVLVEVSDVSDDTDMDRPPG